MRMAARMAARSCPVSDLRMGHAFERVLWLASLLPRLVHTRHMGAIGWGIGFGALGIPPIPLQPTSTAQQHYLDGAEANGMCGSGFVASATLL